jgi:hypothetical protein
MIDDATNIRYGQFFEEETTAGAMRVLSYWIKKYGIPHGRYCDHKNAFVLTREATDAERLKGIAKPNSHFGNACKKRGWRLFRRAARRRRAGKNGTTGWIMPGW